MLRIYHTYTIISLLFFALLCSSCDKELSKLPNNARVAETAITDLHSAKMALNGVYYRFANVNSDNISNWVYNNTTGGLLAGTLSYGLGPLPEEKNDNVNSISPNVQWDYAYQLILAANGVIQGVEKLSETKVSTAEKLQITAEARFLRAYGHFKLLMYFSEWNDLKSKNGVLIRDDFSTLKNISKKRSTVEETYEHILSDLEFAVSHAKIENPNYYANKWAAMALKIRVLACRGTDSDLRSVISIATEMIQTAPYNLEAEVKDIFQQKGLSSKEVILGIKPQSGQEAYYNNLSRFYFPMANRLFTTNSMFKEILQGDPRQSWMVGPETPFQMYSPNTFYFNKFIAMGTEPTQISETQYAIRLSEVYLLKAEAFIRLNSNFADAKNLLRQVMETAGVKDFTKLNGLNNQHELWKFYTVEVLKGFTGEDAIEWFTLIRMPLNLITQLKSTIKKQEQLYFAIPQSELDLNKSFGEQNKGYAL